MWRVNQLKTGERQERRTDTTDNSGPAGGRSRTRVGECERAADARVRGDRYRYGSSSELEHGDSITAHNNTPTQKHGKKMGSSGSLVLDRSLVARSTTHARIVRGTKTSHGAEPTGKRHGAPPLVAESNTRWNSPCPCREKNFASRETHGWAPDN